jgi:hypothetical protein
MFKDIYIEIERLIVKPYSIQDIEDLYKIYRDEKVMALITAIALMVLTYYQV